MNLPVATRIRNLITISQNRIFNLSNLVSNQNIYNMNKQVILIATIVILATPSLGEYKFSAGSGYYGVFQTQVSKDT